MYFISISVTNKMENLSIDSKWSARWATIQGDDLSDEDYCPTIEEEEDEQ